MCYYGMSPSEVDEKNLRQLIAFNRSIEARFKPRSEIDLVVNKILNKIMDLEYQNRLDSPEHIYLIKQLDRLDRLDAKQRGLKNYEHKPRGAFER